MKLILHVTVALATSIAFAAKKDAGNVELDTANSKLTWVGAKKIGDEHTGEVKVQSGSLKMKNNVPTSGQFTIDMKSISNSDVKDSKWRKKLVEHLMSADFFDVAKHPTAKFVIKTVSPFKQKGKTEPNAYTITGNLTIRGKTNKESFQATIVPMGKMFKAKGTLSFDRSKYNVMYRSESNIIKKALKVAKDKIIKDNVNVTFDLTTKPKS